MSCCLPFLYYIVKQYHMSKSAVFPKHQYDRKCDIDFTQQFYKQVNIVSNILDTKLSILSVFVRFCQWKYSQTNLQQKGGCFVPELISVADDPFIKKGI